MPDFTVAVKIFFKGFSPELVFDKLYIIIEDYWIAKKTFNKTVLRTVLEASILSEKSTGKSKVELP